MLYVDFITSAERRDECCFFFFFTQEKYQKLLAEETEKNKDDITHLEMLRKHFGQREAAYAVTVFVSICFRRVLMMRHF